jgi:predicted RNA polymerase sigma factor
MSEGRSTVECRAGAADPTSVAPVDAAATVERVWRAESAGMLGVLARRLGGLDLAEEALQDAVAEALRRWPVDGLPESPAGWLVTTAWRRAVDRIRRDVNGQDKLAEAQLAPPPAPVADDRLALIFGCCHPVLSRSAQVALTLHAASGLSTEQIAAAFLVPVATMAKRLVRARAALRAAGARFELPDRYADRLPAVLAVVYLVFTEGYSTGRTELAREGLELARQLAELLPAEPEVAGLAALAELHAARAATRFDPAGRLVLLADQDRGRWSQPLIAAALARLRGAAERDRPGPYQLQAAIAAAHAVAPSFAETDWVGIRTLYDLLDAVAPSPVVRLSRAVATRYACGPELALSEVDALAAGLGEYAPLHATRAELLRALGREEEALAATRRAHAMATNPVERELLATRLVGPGSDRAGDLAGDRTGDRAGGAPAG